MQLRQFMNLDESAQSMIQDRRMVHRYAEKWSPFLEGLEDRTRHGRYLRNTMAVVFENTAQHLNKLRLYEATTTGNVAYYAKFIFPALRWAFPSLIANDIVSVQPMNSAQGTIFYLDFVYSNSKGQTAAGNIFPRDFDKFYSSEFVEGEPIGVGDGTNFGGAGAALSITLAYNPVHRPSTERGTFVIVREISAADGSVVQEGQIDETGTGVSGDLSSATLNFANGAITNLKFTAEPASGNIIRCFYYYDGELNSQIPQIQLDVKKALITAFTRRLKTVYSSEAAMDLREEHGIDAETELIAAAAQELTLEIDREIINDLFLASTGTQGVFSRTAPAGITELDHLRSLLTVLSEVSNTIHQKTLRAPANWAVVSPTVSALLEQFTTHGDFKPIYSGDMNPQSPIDEPRPLTRHGQFGVYKLGTLLNKYVIYVDPYFQRDFILMGLKGSTYLDSGYAWCPYVPLQITQPFLDPSDLSFRSAMFTRYAKKLLRPEYYGQVRVLNL